MTLLEECPWTVDVTEVPDGVPVFIGQIPLDMFDLVVDLQACRLTGNPAQHGEQVLALYSGPNYFPSPLTGSVGTTPFKSVHSVPAPA